MINLTASIIESLSNHDDDGNKNVTNFRIWQWKTIALHASLVHLGHLAGVFVLSTTWNINDLFCSCTDNVSILWQMFNLVFLSLKLCFQCNSILKSVMTLNSWEMIAKTLESGIWKCNLSTSCLLKLSFRAKLCVGVSGCQWNFISSFLISFLFSELPQQFQWDFHTDKNFKEKLASFVSSFCSVNRKECAIKETSRERWLLILLSLFFFSKTWNL